MYFQQRIRKLLPINLEPIEIRVGRKHMFLFFDFEFKKLKNQSSFTLWGILFLIPWNQFWQNRSFRNWKSFYGYNEFSFYDKRREFVHWNYPLLDGFTLFLLWPGRNWPHAWSLVEIRLVTGMLVILHGWQISEISPTLMLAYVTPTNEPKIDFVQLLHHNTIDDIHFVCTFKAKNRWFRAFR